MICRVIFLLQIGHAYHNNSHKVLHIHSRVILSLFILSYLISFYYLTRNIRFRIGSFIKSKINVSLTVCAIRMIKKIVLIKKIIIKKLLYHIILLSKKIIFCRILQKSFVY